MADFLVLEAGAPGGQNVHPPYWSARRVHHGFDPPEPQRAVCIGEVRCEADAAAAVLAALNGAHLIVEAHASRDVIDRLCDDLRRVGTLEHRVGPATGLPRLSNEQLQLLRCLLAGSSLGQAAAELHISRRTADRRIAEIRQLLGASSTSAALVRAVQLGFSAARGSEA